MTQLMIILNLSSLLFWCLTHRDIEWSTPLASISVIITLGIFELTKK